MPNSIIGARLASAAIAHTGGAACVSMALCAALTLASCGMLAPARRAAPELVVRTSAADGASAVALISKYRAAQGLDPVTFDPILAQAAEMQARAVASEGELSHGDFAGRMREFGAPGIAAENLSAGYPDVAKAIASWKGSPGHNANLLLAGARRIGIARVDTPGIGYKTYWALVLAQ